MATKKEPDNTPRTRDERGRFTKGTCGNPSGRPKLPAQIKEYGKEAPSRLRAIADAPDTPVKVKADIEKWFAEMTYGKAVQQQVVDASVEQTAPTIIKFEGELDEWSK